MFVVPVDIEPASTPITPRRDSSMKGTTVSSTTQSAPTRGYSGAEDNLPVKILIVDDHPENLLALEATLGRAGGPKSISEPIRAEFIRARSGHEALRKVLDDSFAVILMDVQMPGMDGYETAELIRKRPQSQSTPIIFLTAVSTSDAHISRGYALGAVDYITKPFDPWVLKAKVGVFVDLYRKRREIERMADVLREQTDLLRESNAELGRTNTTLATLYNELEEKSTELHRLNEELEHRFTRERGNSKRRISNYGTPRNRPSLPIRRRINSLLS